ncbi:MAG: LamG domain-containing protein [Acutalibacteraceae bacterium]|jgi:hypothetical protein
MRRRLWAIGLIAVLLFSASAPASANYFSAPPGYEDGRLVIADEAASLDDEYVIYHHGGVEALPSHIVWTNGRAGHGQAVDLSGGGDYLSIGYNQLRLTTFTVSMWVNWRGAGDGDADQPLLTAGRDEDNKIVISTWRRDDALKSENGHIANGLFLEEVVTGEREVGYKPSAPDASTALPQNEWHHLALVGKNPYLSLYLDGELWAQVLWNIGLREFDPNFMRFGGGLDGAATGGTFNGLLDDATVYTAALTDEQIRLLAAGEDPMDPDATLPTTTVITTTQAPATTTQATAAASEPAAEDPALNTVSRDPSLRLALIVVGAGAALFLVLTVLSLLFGKKRDR